MNRRFKTIAIMGNTADAAARESITTLIEHLTAKGLQALVSEQRPGSGSLPDDEIAAQADLVIAVGGDGTTAKQFDVARQSRRGWP